MTDWSAPDAEGIRTRVLSGRNALERQRLRRCDTLDEAATATWPSSWRELAIEWLRGSGERSRWPTLLERAGEKRVGASMQLLAALLAAGWIELDERRDPRGQWVPMHLRWLQHERLAVSLGLPDKKALRAQAEQLHDHGFEDARLPALADSLKGRPPVLLLKRMQLLQALDHWLREGRQGTRRQFAQIARGGTKSVSNSEWQWLDETLGLATLGIDAHTPGLWLRAPLHLRTHRGGLDLAVVSDAIALTPATIAAVTVIDGRIGSWRVVENRTSFEQASIAHGDSDGVLWLPGFAPPWWRQAVQRLLTLAPAPLLIACDPDPAGVRIAWSVAELWQAAGQPWRPWCMDAEDLLALPAHLPLGDYDHAELTRLRELPLPPALVRLIETMVQQGFKGEQEGIDFRRA